MAACAKESKPDLSESRVLQWARGHRGPGAIVLQWARGHRKHGGLPPSEVGPVLTAWAGLYLADEGSIT